MHYHFNGLTDAIIAIYPEILNGAILISQNMYISITETNVESTQRLLQQLLTCREWSATVCEIRISWYPSYVPRHGNGNGKNVEIFLELLPILKKLENLCELGFAIIVVLSSNV